MVFAHRLHGGVNQQRAVQNRLDLDAVNAGSDPRTGKRQRQFVPAARIEGHRRGANAVHEVVRAAREIGVKALTLYAFSAQNWLRPPEEVGMLMRLLREYVIAERAERAALIVTTNLPFSEWTQVFPNPRLCKALLDRITDRAHIIETGIESYRFRRTLEVRQKKKAQAST